MKIFLIMACIILALLFLLFIAFKLLRNQKKSIGQLKEELKNQQQNIISLYKHAEEIAEIEKENKATVAKIEEAKSDEEILDIINTVIAVNNSKLCDSPKK